MSETQSANTLSPTSSEHTAVRQNSPTKQSASGSGKRSTSSPNRSPRIAYTEAEPLPTLKPVKVETELPDPVKELEQLFSQFHKEASSILSTSKHLFEFLQKLSELSKPRRGTKSIRGAEIVRSSGTCC
eukprot:TRINITY_DN6996_c0_g1_i1.p1 TRINITY_DN6996_c0_g1~~TRINITY_DN6996_c0_g1_i1.p1  ORF type:complete len:138 (+),score=25.96 TRINITY_DN6996_c0_g1_i1:30-416(+)